MQSRAIAASDTSVKEGELGGAQMIMSSNGNEVLSNRLFHKKQDKNSSKVAEAVVLLELVKVIASKSRNIREGKIIIALDCREVYKSIVNKIFKSTKLVGDGGGEIALIRKAISTATIQIEFQLKRGHPNKQPLFCQNPLQQMVCECDKRATEEREMSSERSNTTNLKFVEVSQ